MCNRTLTKFAYQQPLGVDIKLSKQIGVTYVLCVYTMVNHGGTQVLYLKKRLGFIRLALEAGASLVPVFLFGQASYFN